VQAMHSAAVVMRANSTRLPGVNAPERICRAICAGNALQQQRAHAERRRLLGGGLCNNTTT